jgi:hypothetical protein
VRLQAVATTVVVGAAAALGGCAASVEGDFEGLAFAPTRTVIAVLDSHDIFEARGALVPVERPRAQMRVTLLLTSADVPTTEAWRQLPAERLLDVRKDLATSDLLLLDGIDFDTLQDTVEGRPALTAQTDDVDATAGVARGTGDFAFAIGTRAAVGERNGLGGVINVELSASRFDRAATRGGDLDATITVRRDRASGQPENDLATGTVVVRLAVPLAPERVAEANVAIAAPIARCKAELGPDAGLACATVVADPVTDETGSR